MARQGSCLTRSQELPCEGRLASCRRASSPITSLAAEEMPLGAEDGNDSFLIKARNLQNTLLLYSNHVSAPSNHERKHLNL